MLNKQALATSIRLAQGVSRQTGLQVEQTGHHDFAAGLWAARYLLPNGLTVLLAPNPQTPIFAYQTWFSVGSRDEHPHRTGLAHLFEHLMFKGTERYPNGTFDEEMERRGSQTNAATWLDWTYYTEELPARGDNLTTVIDFEADRMTHLVLDAATFASELDVVKNERRMLVDNAVTGEMNELLMAKSFTQHPYRWPTIGSMDHLSACTLADVQAFYRAHYGPKRATVVLTGGFDPYEALLDITRAYGNLLGATQKRAILAPEPPQTMARQCVIDRDILSSQLMLGYHAPAQTSSDFAATVVLAEILGGGQSSRLYQALVLDKALATDVSCDVLPVSEPGLLEIHIMAREGADLPHVLDVAQQELDRLSLGVVPEELQMACSSLELNQLQMFANSVGLAEALGHFECTQNNFSRGFLQLAEYQQVTALQVQHLAQQLLAAAKRTCVIARAEGKPNDLKT